MTEATRAILAKMRKTIKVKEVWERRQKYIVCGEHFSFEITEEEYKRLESGGSL